MYLYFMKHEKQIQELRKEINRLMLKAAKDCQMKSPAVQAKRQELRNQIKKLKS